MLCIVNAVINCCVSLMLWLSADSQASRARIAPPAAVPVTKVHRTEKDDGDCGLLRAEFSAYGQAFPED